MTKIVSLRLKNFKSFRKAEIPFSEGFTAIAGANASGKSNILDALLFAMGITSLRLLRASKLTELVNHDATEGYAKVELGIKDRNGRDILITRMVDRAGKSVYRLDGKRKTLNEVQSLLLELGVNPNGHNIVVQGDITRVIEMNAKQRRQIIEEAAGLQEFEEKKDEALNKLEKVEQKVKDAHLILNEREAYLQQLEVDKENAMRYNALIDETRQSKATILSEEIKINSRGAEESVGKLAQMNKEIEDKRMQRSSLQEEERELERKVEEATKQLIDASEKTYTSLGKDVEQKRGHLNLVAERISQKSISLQSRRQKVLELKDELKETKKRIAEKQEQLTQALDALEKADSQLESVRKTIDSRGPKFDKKNAEIKGSEERVSDILKELSALKDKLHGIQMEKHGVQKQAMGASQALLQLEAHRKSLEARLAAKKEAESKIFTLEKKSPAQKLAAKEGEIEEIAAGIHSLHGKMEGMQDSLDTLSKSKSECPVCEKPLESARKEKIHSKRSGEINSARAKTKELQEKHQLLLSQKSKIQSEVRELSDLVASLRVFGGVEEELREMKSRMGSYRESAKLQDAHFSPEQEKTIQKSLGLLEKEKALLEEKIRGSKEGEDNLEMNTLLQKLHGFNSAKNEKENIATRLTMEIEKVLSARVGAIASETGAAEKEIGGLESEILKMEKEKTETQKALLGMEAELEKESRANKLLEEEKDRLTAKINAISNKREELGRKIESREKEMNELNIEMSKNEVRLLDLQEEFRDYSSIEPLKDANLNELKKRLPEIEKEIEKLGAINMKSLENFDTFKNEVDDVRQKANKLDEERLAVIEMIQKIEVKKLSVFMECFNHVARKFSELYFRFFGGIGLLDLNDKISPLEGGLLIQAKYKEDTLKSIDAMSGGEKSLTALAFLFAIQSFSPSPFYIFDEVDAALDKENSVKVGNMVKEQSMSSQFIAISHNDAVINQADQIIGVALNKHKSSVIGLRLHKGAHDEPVMAPGEDAAEEQG